ncbi:hypothetical protein OY671_012178, partial [Metschnikowia pulcherrima]
MVDVAWTPYCGPAPDPAEALGRWNGDSISLSVMAVATTAGLISSREQQRGRFSAAMAVSALGFISPSCPLSSASFMARTSHHSSLVLAAAPSSAL